MYISQIFNSVFNLTVTEAASWLKKTFCRVIEWIYVNRSQILDSSPFFLLLLVLIISPLPCASTPYWAVSISLILIFTAMISWCISVISHPDLNYCHPEQREGSYILATCHSGESRNPVNIVASPLLYALLALTGLALFQLIPFPISIYKHLSPYRYELLSQLLPPGTQWYPLSLSPFLTYKELLKLLGFASSYFLILNTVNTPRKFKILAYTIIAMGFFEAIYGMTEHFGKTYRILFWKDPYGGESSSGTFINENHYSSYLNLCFWITVGIILDKIRKEWPEAETWREKLLLVFSEQTSKLLLLLFIPAVIGIAIYSSQSRGGLINLAMGFLCFTGLLTLKGYSTPKIRIGLLCIVSLLAILLIQLPDWASFIAQFSVVPVDEMITSEASRWTMWDDSLNLSHHFKLLGSGLGTLVHVLPHFQSQIIVGDLLIDHAHNDYVELLSEIGIIGFFTILAILALHIFRGILKSRNFLSIASTAAIIGFALHSIFEFNTHIPANFLLFLVVLYTVFPSQATRPYLHSRTSDNTPLPLRERAAEGYVQHSSFSSPLAGEVGRRPGEGERLGGKNYKKLLPIVLIIISLWEIFSVYRLSVADIKIKEIEKTFEAGTTEELSRLLAEVSSYTPNDARVWYYSALLSKLRYQRHEISLHELHDQKMKFLTPALRLNPTNAHLHLELALAYLNLGIILKSEGRLTEANLAFKKAYISLGNAQILAPTKQKIKEKCETLRNTLQSYTTHL